MENLSKLLSDYAAQIRAFVDEHIDEDDVLSHKDTEEKISDINEGIILKEEKQKLQLRETLTGTVKGFIWVQLIFFSIIILLIVCAVTLNTSIFNKIDNQLASLLFEFLKYYIGATIVELLGMLGFILHYVFSKYSGIERIRNISKK